MDLKTLKVKILGGSIARRVLLRAFMVALALSLVPLLQNLSGVDSGIFTSVACHDCALNLDNSNPFMFTVNYLYQNLFIKPVCGSYESMQCQDNVNLTVNVVRELLDMKMLNHDAKALCVGDGSASAVLALRDMGFSNACGVYRHPFFSLKHKRFVYELDYEENSFDFVLSKGLDMVSVPALLVLEVERVLRPGGIGAILVGISGSGPNRLIKSATPVSSLLKTSDVVHVDYINELTLVVFRKKYENVDNFEQHHLPADCLSLTNSKPYIEYMEPLVEEKPIDFEKKIAYMPKFVDVFSRKRLVYIDIGAGKHLNSNFTSWFFPSYPVDSKAFNVYFVDHNTSVLLSHVKKPGVTFVYYPGLAEDIAGNKAVAGRDIVEDLDPSLEDEGFEFFDWFKETVEYADFVVLKMNTGKVELKFLSKLFKSGTICLVDELFLHCSDPKGVGRNDCMELFKGLRSSGVFVHQWWGD